jgi:hypothetical protein
MDRLYDSETELPPGWIAQIQDIIYPASHCIVRRPLVVSHQHLKGNTKSLGYSTIERRHGSCSPRSTSPQKLGEIPPRSQAFWILKPAVSRSLRTLIANVVR